MSIQVPSKKIQCLKLSGDLAENWKSFLKIYKLHEEAYNVLLLPEHEKIEFFIKAIGPDACTIFNSLTAYQRSSYEMVMSAYKNHCLPKKSVMLQRSVFYKRKQDSTELFDEFYYDLQAMAMTCDFGCDEERMIIDQIVNGVNDSGMRRKLKKFKHMQLPGVVEFCREWEYVELQRSTNTVSCCGFWCAVFCNWCKLRILLN